MAYREGFWQSKDQLYFPMPIPSDNAWHGQQEFLNSLAKIEARASENHFKGSSTCRICDCRNGSTEFNYGNWIWPEGYRHYIEMHNVRPSLAFQEFILKHQVDKPIDFANAGFKQKGGVNAMVSQITERPPAPMPSRNFKTK